MGRQLSELRRHKGATAGVAVFILISVVLTSMVAGTLARDTVGDTMTVTAVFRDATGLRVGDDVRLAGVRVGRVVGTRLGTGDQRGLAIVTLRVEASQRIAGNTIAAIDYLNLMGQRYVALQPPAGTPAGRLADGATIPVADTRPALDLTAMFNAFRPIFDLLDPTDINQLARNIIGALQGEGPTLRVLLRQTAGLTHGLVDRDAILSRVSNNVIAVLRATDQHRTAFTRLLGGLARLSTGLAGDRREIAGGLDSLARLSRETARVIEQAGPSIVDDARLSAAWLRYLRTHRAQIVAAGGALPTQLRTYLRTLDYGSYLNVYVCSLGIRLKGTSTTLDVGPGDRHSARCA
ncbi:MAG TPA: MlaD family protein [Nocardioides sp.]|nr:MlaD family protein [Nocardioides sp.]